MIKLELGKDLIVELVCPGATDFENDDSLDVTTKDEVGW